jgi:hypothetical protein
MPKQTFSLTVNYWLISVMDPVGPCLLLELYRQADLAWGKHNWYASQFWIQENNQTLTIKMEAWRGKVKKDKIWSETKGEPPT